MNERRDGTPARDDAKTGHTPAFGGFAGSLHVCGMRRATCVALVLLAVSLAVGLGTGQSVG